MKKIDKLLSKEARRLMENEIRSAGGNEVFFVGILDEDSLVTSVKAYARGNDKSVSAVRRAAEAESVVIHNHPGDDITPSDADVDIASRLAENRIGFYIVNNDVSKAYVVVEPARQEKLARISDVDIDDFFLPGGVIANALGKYECRGSQVLMAKKTASAFNSSGIGLIEAGAGTGKTFAYLVPAILWAVKNKERVVISTNTINLQEQLIKKDIPFLARAMKEDFKAALVKGRGNYACIWKSWQVEKDTGEHFKDDQADEIADLLRWLGETKDGTKSDLSFVPHEAAWEKISCESDLCLRARCPAYKDCFLVKARRKAAGSQILVVNHHILFADLSLRGDLDNFDDIAILPPYSRLIIDEAHNIEDVATAYFGKQFSRIGLERMLSRFYRTSSKGVMQGFNHFLVEKLKKRLGKKHRSDELKNIIRLDKKLVKEYKALKDKIEEFFNIIHNEVLPHYLGKASGSLRIVPEVTSSQIWEDVFTKEINLLINGFVRALGLQKEFYDSISRIAEEEEGFADDQICHAAYISRAGRAVDVMTAFESCPDNETHIRWIEAKVGSPKGKKRTLISFYMAPLSIDNIMQEAVLRPFKTVVMTSATLTVEKSFDYIRSRIGLHDDFDREHEEVLLESEFDYKSQVLLAIPQDIPSPSSAGFNEAAKNIIGEMCLATRGQTFVLFTSYSMMNALWDDLSELLCAAGIRGLKQGMTPRHKLLDLFRRSQPSVLFGTLSFWEGVDVVGSTLSSVILTRLPFGVPTNPVHEARMEHMKKRGLDPFFSYALPNAIIKFRQGFGRLIRSKTDKGLVTVLDTRILKKNYGKTFLASLPECCYYTGPANGIAARLASFLSD